MPEMRFKVRWPDASEMSCYSPSLVVKEFLTINESYTVEDFVRRTGEALSIASERVKQKYGFYCTSAAAQREEIERAAARFTSMPEARVIVTAFEEQQ